MKIIAVSDTHGRPDRLIEAVEKYTDADLFVHCGDGASDLEIAENAYPHKKFYGVCGNCDFICSLPPEILFTADGKRVYVTHGHLYDVKHGLYRLLDVARKHRADIVLFGHTHSTYCRYRDGIWFVNPGAGRGRGAKAAVVDICGDSVTCRLEEIEDEV